MYLGTSKAPIMLKTLSLEEIYTAHMSEIFTIKQTSDYIPKYSNTYNSIIYYKSIIY